MKCFDNFITFNGIVFKIFVQKKKCPFLSETIVSIFIGILPKILAKKFQGAFKQLNCTFFGVKHFFHVGKVYCKNIKLISSKLFESKISQKLVQ